MLEQPLHLLTPEDKKTPQYQEMRARIEAVKAEMRAVANDPSLTKEEKLKIMSETLLPKLEKAQRFRKEGEIPETLAAGWPDPETGEIREITLRFEEETERFEEFYRRHFNIALDKAEIQGIIRENLEEMKEEIEKHGYDQILILPENLPENEELNQKLIEAMEEPGKGKVEKTHQWNSFKDNGSWAGAKSAEKPKTRIILTHSAQSLADHPILKATRNKNIMELTGLSQEEIQKRIQNKEPLPVNFGGVRAEGLSMEEYLVFQRIYFEKNQEHLDEEGWARLLKSRLKATPVSFVACASWSPGYRQLSAGAVGVDLRDDYLGCRLSRSFSKS